MVLLCFVLDLSSLSPPLLRDLKQCLLQLANLYAVSSPPSRYRSYSLRDRIGLCYVCENRISHSSELKVAYSPEGSFSLRDFHHAVNNLPGDLFSPKMNDSGAAFCSSDPKLSNVLSDQVLYSWGDKDVMRKAIILSSHLLNNIDSETKKTLMDAADRCVSVEFVAFEQSSSHLVNMQESVKSFSRSLSDLDNCSFHAYFPDARVLHGLVKRWLQDLKDDMDEPMQARFVFENNLLGSQNQIFCCLSLSVSQIVDGFNACKTCRCHGIQLDNAVKDKLEEPSCPVTGLDLELSEVMEHSVKVGGKTILFVPSFQKSTELQRVSSPVAFTIIERTNLSSLSEGVLAGCSYFVTPSACHDIEASSEELDHSDFNAKLFQGICNSLHSMDQGLVCSSYCNVETMKETTFRCFYLLHPSENGPMLLRRLAGSEEVLPTPNANRFIDSPVSKEIQSAIQTSLLKMNLRDYNPILHERGFHQKLSVLVKESIQFGSIPPKQNEPASERDSKPCDLLEVGAESNHQAEVVIVKEDALQLDEVTAESTAAIADEWEQLVVNEIPNTYSPTCMLNQKMDQFAVSPSDSNKQLDAKTSRILERLEVPRQLKRKVHSPIVASNGISEVSVPTKMSLIQLQHTQATEQSVTSSQLMKPNFQKLKRKYK